MLSWYKELHKHKYVLTELLTLENDQLPDGHKQGYAKAMASISIGFYSNSAEVTQLTFQLLIDMFRQFQHSIPMLDKTLKWFFNAEGMDEQGKSGLKLALFALRKHYEVASQLLQLIDTFTQVDEQLKLIYSDEV